MRSQLTDANISNINDANWVADYSYYKNGDMAYRIIQSDNQPFDYNGHQMTSADGSTLSYDENGQLTAGLGASLVWNWDNKLRSAEKADTSLNLKYDPAGNRIAKDVNVSHTLTARKYIVDIVGDLPVILLEIDDSNNAVKKTYIYANSQIIAQHDGNTTDPRYFYLHDRLGSVRLVIDTSGVVKNCYTYNPFGELFASETTENVLNPFKFTGQFYDLEIGQYYLHARQYDPYISRFTSRDPADGKFEEPLTLHVYLYCLNDPINKIDPIGEWAVTQGYSINATEGRGGVTVTIQYFYGMSDDLTFFCGYMLTIAGGSEPTGRLGLSGSLSAVAGYSPDAQSPEDLGGFFLEFGGSGPAGPGFVGGGNWAWNPTTGITLRTVSFGVGGGAEIHGQGSHTFIFGDLTIGPSMHERKRSPFEQFLTNLIYR